MKERRGTRYPTYNLCRIQRASYKGKLEDGAFVPGTFGTCNPRGGCELSGGATTMCGRIGRWSL